MSICCPCIKKKKPRRHLLRMHSTKEVELANHSKFNFQTADHQKLKDEEIFSQRGTNEKENELWD